MYVKTLWQFPLYLVSAPDFVPNVRGGPWPWHLERSLERAPRVMRHTLCDRRNSNLLPQTIHGLEKIEKLADLITYPISSTVYINGEAFVRSQEFYTSCSLCDTRHCVHPFLEDWRCDQLRALTSCSGLRSEGGRGWHIQPITGRPGPGAWPMRGEYFMTDNSCLMPGNVIIRIEQETALQTHSS